MLESNTITTFEIIDNWNALLRHRLLISSSPKQMISKIIDTLFQILHIIWKNWQLLPELSCMIFIEY